MPPVLYKRQRELMAYISSYMQKYGYAPTLPEMCDALGLRSPATVHEHVQNLVDKGMIRKIDGIRRGIEVVDQKVAGWVGGVDVPLVGFIAAGQPIEAIEDTTTTISIPADMMGRKRTFVLQVRGDSMIEAHIQDGDYVVVEENQTASNGEIVVAILNDNFATLKRYYRESDHVRLEPANSSMNPIISKDVKIQGKVVGVIRKYS